MSLGEMVLNVCDSPSHHLLSDKAQWFKEYGICLFTIACGMFMRMFRYLR